MGFHLEKDEPIGSGCQRILVEQAVRLAEDLARADDDFAKAIHEVRKRCKRVRAVARLLRPNMKAFYREENAAFRQMARRLSPFRDADVRLQTFDDLVSRADEAKRFAALRELMRGKDDHSDPEFLQEQLSVTANAVEAAKARLEKASLPSDPGFKLIEPGLRDSYKRGRRAMSEASDQLDGVAFHEWRKRVKDLGYQIQILRELWPALLKRLHSELDKLGDLLGKEHDLTVVQDTAKKEADNRVKAGDLQALLALANHRKSELQTEAHAIGERIYAERPRDFLDRIRVYWETWQMEVPAQADQPTDASQPVLASSH